MANRDLKAEVMEPRFANRQRPRDHGLTRRAYLTHCSLCGVRLESLSEMSAQRPLPAAQRIVRILEDAEIENHADPLRDLPDGPDVGAVGAALAELEQLASLAAHPTLFDRLEMPAITVSAQKRRFRRSTPGWKGKVIEGFDYEYSELPVSSHVRVKARAIAVGESGELAVLSPVYFSYSAESDIGSGIWLDAPNSAAVFGSDASVDSFAGFLKDQMDSGWARGAEAILHLRDKLRSLMLAAAETLPQKPSGPEPRPVRPSL